MIKLKRIGLSFLLLVLFFISQQAQNCYALSKEDRCEIILGKTHDICVFISKNRDKVCSGGISCHCKKFYHLFYKLSGECNCKENCYGNYNYDANMEWLTGHLMHKDRILVLCSSGNCSEKLWGQNCVLRDEMNLVKGIDEDCCEEANYCWLPFKN